VSHQSTIAIRRQKAQKRKNATANLRVSVLKQNTVTPLKSSKKRKCDFEANNKPEVNNMTIFGEAIESCPGSHRTRPFNPSNPRLLMETGQEKFFSQGKPNQLAQNQRKHPPRRTHYNPFKTHFMASAKPQLASWRNRDLNSSTTIQSQSNALIR
jgi:hypothetical protein